MLDMLAHVDRPQFRRIALATWLPIIVSVLLIWSGEPSLRGPAGLLWVVSVVAQALIGVIYLRLRVDRFKPRGPGPSDRIEARW